MWEVGPYVLQRCPLTQVDSRVDSFFEYYNKYLKGYLPDEGGWRDQAAVFNDVIKIIEREYVNVAEKKKKK